MSISYSLKWETNIKKQSLISLPAIFCAGCLVILAGCETRERPSITDNSTPKEEKATSSTKRQWVEPMDVDMQIEFSKRDLSKRFAIKPEAVSVSAATFVDWRSGAMGCPEPGMSYTQALVPGVLIKLIADRQTYSYHAKLNGIPFLCPKDRVEKPALKQGADET